MRHCFLIVLTLAVALISCHAQHVEIHKRDGAWMRGDVVAMSDQSIHMADGSHRWTDIDTLIFRSYRSSDSTLVGRLKKANIIVIGSSVNKYFNFVIENNDSVWKYIYHKNGDNKSKMKRQLMANPYIKNIRETEAGLVADIENWQIDYKKEGGSHMSTSMAVTGGKWNGRVLIDFRDGKYRVSVSGLNFDAGSVGVYGGGITINQDIFDNWADWTLNKPRTDFKRNQNKNMKLMDSALRTMFTITNPQQTDDW
jgi:hypothetical protein